MNGELARKQPATVVKTRPAHRPPIQGKVGIQMKSRTAADRKVQRLLAEGRILPEWTMRQSGPHWIAEVTFVPAPARHRAPLPWLKIWAVSMVSILMLMTGYVVAQAIALAVAAIVPFIVGGALILAALGLLAGRKVFNISQNINVR